MVQNIKNLMKSYWIMEGRMELIVYAIFIGILTLSNQFTISLEMPGVARQTHIFAILIPVIFIFSHSFKCVAFESLNSFPSNAKSRFLANVATTHIYIVAVTIINVLYYLIGCGLFKLQEIAFHNIDTSHTFNGTYLVLGTVDMLAVFLACYSVFSVISIIFARLKPLHFYIFSCAVFVIGFEILKVYTKEIYNVIDYLWIENHGMYLAALFLVWLLGLVVCWLLVTSFKKCPSIDVKHLGISIFISYICIMAIGIASLGYNINVTTYSTEAADFQEMPYHFEKCVELPDIEKNYISIFDSVSSGDWSIKDEFQPILGKAKYITFNDDTSMIFYTKGSWTEVLSESEAGQSDNPHINQVKVEDGNCFICFSANPATFMGQQFMDRYFEQMEDTLHYDKEQHKMSYSIKKPSVLFTPLGSVNRYKDKTQYSNEGLGNYQISVVLSDKDYEVYCKEYMEEE